jgi:BirA family transcriptional regulator, biotin operon repressor / biotin---[acetyl-CoA-carboxylase] ligase
MIYPDFLKVIILERCDSTNNYLKKHYGSLLHHLPVLISSAHQTSGRGREKRKWISPPGKGLYTSFGFKLSSHQNLNLLPLIAGITVIETLNRISKIEFGLKWPNDILYQDKKIAGILIENVIADSSIFSITGIGINLNHESGDFPPGLQKKAVSLKIITGVAPDYCTDVINPLLAAVFFNWLEKLENDAREEILQTAIGYSQCLLNKRISFHKPTNNEITTGIFRGINRNGGLILENEEGLSTIYFSGEIV